MADSFRIEIPIVVTDAGSSATVGKIEAELNRLMASMGRVSGTGAAAFAGISGSASSAAGAMAGASSAAAQAEGSIDKLDGSADKAADSVEEIGDAAQQAGSEASSAISSAAGQVDQFSQRVEKSQKSLRDAFKEKMNLTLAAIDKASPIIKSITSSLKNITRKAWNIAVKVADFVTAPFQKLVKMITSPLVMTLSLAGVGMGASSFVSTFKEFTAGMSNVKALSGATNEEFVKLTETAEHLGATTKFTAAEASEGMQYLAMAGWKTNQIIEAMPGLLDLAAAGGTSLGTAADIVSDVMTAMGMSADQASRAADIFARTATSTNTTIENLGETMKYAAPAANAFGLSLSEATTIAGMMANAGIKGSMAGTALRTSLLQMASPTKSASKAMADLGLTFADDTGKMKDMKTIVKDLGTAFAGLSDQQKLQYAEDLFGKQASSAWLSIISQGADEYERLFEAIDNSAGAAKEMAETQMDNLAGDMTKLQSAVDGMKISVMKELEPTLRKGVQWLTSKIPEITEKLTNVAKVAVEKFGQVKDFLVGVFDSPEMKNADSLVDKLFIAWDKIIAEPFQKWWDGGGQDKILGIVEKIGTNLGELWHGIFSGVFAAINGEEIDAEGMNLTGIAKAGAEVAKKFVESFVKAFDLSDLWAKMPGLLKGGLLAFGGLKIGGGIISLLKTVGQVKLAFGGVATAASGAGTAVAGVGAKAAASAGLFAKLGSGVSLIGKGLAAIPGWGWVAAAAIAAVAIGVTAYAKAQEAHRQEILHLGDAAAESADKYQDSVRDVRTAADTIEKIKELEIRIKENKGGNEEVIAEVKKKVADLTEQEITIEVKFARGEVKEEDYLAEIEKLDGKKIEIIAQLTEEGYNTATVQAIVDQYNQLESGQKEIAIIIAKKTDISADEIATYVTRLTELMGQKTEYELIIQGSGLTPDEIKERKDRLAEIEDRKASLEVQINKGQGNMSDEDWNNLVTEYNGLTQQAGEIKLELKGAEMNEQEIKTVKDKLGEVRGEASGILLNIGYDESSTLSQSDIDHIASTLGEIGDVQAQINISLADGSLSPKEIQDTQKALDTMYERLAEMSGGTFTAEELKDTVTQEQVVQMLQKKSDIELAQLENDVAAGRRKTEEGVQRREEYGAQVEASQAAIANAEAAKARVYEMSQEADLLNVQKEGKLAAFRNDEITYEDYNGWMNETYVPQMEALQKEYNEKIAPTMVDSEGYGYGFGEMSFLDLEEYSGFTAALEEISEYIDQEKQTLAEHQGDYDQQSKTLTDLYEAEKTLSAGKILNGTDLAGYSVEELAANYTKLDSEQKKLFETALEGLDAVNKAADYLPESEKTSVGEILGSIVQGANAEAVSDVVGDISSKLKELSTTYDTLKDDDSKKIFDEQNLEAVNKALKGLGLEEISSIGDLSEKLSAISELDVSKLNFDDAAKSLEALGGDASSAKTKLDAAKKAADALAGTYEVTVVYKEEGSLPDAPENAYGGIYDGAFLSWVAEDGPEAIIPLGADKHARGLDLWLQAGRALGVTEFADGGLMAPYSGLMGDIPEGDDGYGLPPAGNGGGGNSIQANVEVNPVFQIEGGDGEDILEKLKEKQKELAEILGGAMADQLEEILENMV